MKTLTTGNQQVNLSNVITNGGPLECEYELLNQYVNGLSCDEEIRFFRNQFQSVLVPETLYGHTYLKPFGYAGDFLLIEKIYQHFVTNNPAYKSWDEHFHTHISIKAVINRKTFFLKVLEEMAYSGKPVRVLILGSGPATDVHEFFERNPEAPVSFDLLDIDQRSIDFAQEKNRLFLDRITFRKMNVLRFLPSGKYDLIWSAGLFDYLNDRVFVTLINRFKNYLNPDGEMIIGNFSPYNPSRKCMEIMVEWFLIHRSNADLLKLAHEAGIPLNAVYVDQEPLGINLFLRMSKKINVPVTITGINTKMNILS